jgi:phospholipid/cholesterol/gamma-HCH transport system substrate-binding protein
VGHVTRVSLSGSSNPGRTVRIDMSFQRRFLGDIPDDSTIAITAGNLLGDKYVNISRGMHPKHIEPGSEIRSTSTQDIGSVLARADVPLKQFNDVLDRVDTILKYVDSKQGSLGHLIYDSDFEKHVDNITALVKQTEIDFQNGSGVVFRLSALRADADKPMARIGEMTARVDRGEGTLGGLMHDPALTAEANATLAEARRTIDEASKDKAPGEAMSRISAAADQAGKLIDRATRGQGSLGKLLTDPQMTDSLAQIRAELKSLGVDFGKHPLRFVHLEFALF